MKCNRLSHLRIIERRWVLLILLFLVMPACNTNTKSTIDSCKVKMIENINQGNFEEAFQYISCVEDWTFDAKNNELLIEVDPALKFASYIDTTYGASELKDSLLLYLKAECNDIAILLYNNGKYREALGYANLSSDIVKTVLGGKHQDYATVLNILGLIYEEMGNYEKAEQCLTTALQIEKSIYSEYHPNYATILENLGSLYDEMENFAKAEICLLKALQIRETMLGKQHLSSANTLDLLGNIASDIGNYAESEQYLIEALRIKKIN